MVKALAPSLRRGSSWVWLSIVTGGITLSPALAQKPQDGTATKAATPAKAASAPQEKAAPAEAEKPEQKPADPTGYKRDSGEVFKDPKAEDALPNTFAQLPYPTPRPGPQDATAIRNMASGLVQPDRNMLDRYVAMQAAELTNRANIRALVDPPANQSPSSQSTRAIERASAALIEPLAIAKAQQPPNNAFLAVYIPIIQTRLTPVLDNHLLARIEASIVLGTAGSPNFIDIYVKQLANDKQVAWVKLWAARGITNATQGGQVPLSDVTKGGVVAGTLMKLLNDLELPWPVQMRVLEAIGANRLASSTINDRKADVLDAVVATLADPDARPDVRAWAAWAAGNLNVNSSIAKVNYPLITHHIGALVADIGDRIGAEYDNLKTRFEKNKGPAAYLTGLLLAQIEPALAGNPNLRGSGIANNAHPSASANKNFATGLDTQVRAVSRAAVELIRAGGTAQEAARKNLAAKVADLRTFLADPKVKLTDESLTPGGEKYPLGTASKSSDKDR